MDVRILLFLLLLGTSRCCNARVATTNSFPVENGFAPALQQINDQQQENEVEVGQELVLQQINDQQQENEIEVVEELAAIKQICTLCQKIAAPVLKFLSNGSNQKKITSVLKKICSIALGLKDKCNGAVNYYLPLVYTQVALWTPKTFCITAKLCDIIPSTSHHLSENGCEYCEDLVTEVLLKLKDPNTRLEATEILLKACDAMEDFEGLPEKCKTLVSGYTPLILGSLEQLLERYDVCNILPVCSPATNATEYVHSALSGKVL